MNSRRFIRSPRRRAAAAESGRSRPSALAVLRLIDQIELAWAAATGKLAGFVALENPVDIDAGLAIGLPDAAAIANADRRPRRELAPRIDRGQRVTRHRAAICRR